MPPKSRSFLRLDVASGTCGRTSIVELTRPSPTDAQTGFSQPFGSQQEFANRFRWSLVFNRLLQAIRVVDMEIRACNTFHVADGDPPSFDQRYWNDTIIQA